MQFVLQWVFAVEDTGLQVWGAILRYAFGVLGSIVLLSLLIGALGDTFDRVMLTRVAESIRSRAAAVERRAFSCLLVPVALAIPEVSHNPQLISDALTMRIGVAGDGLRSGLTRTWRG